jgi:NAD(P)H-dependent flavin oxidoreductase YrpB (nitropropane dioxygenase family)
MTLQESFGIEFPLVQAPMAGVQGSALASAVSNAGGLGSLPCAMLGPAGIADEQRIRLTGRGHAGERGQLDDRAHVGLQARELGRERLGHASGPRRKIRPIHGW